VGSRFSSQVWSHYEHDAVSINAFIALDASANVVGFQPTLPGVAVATTPYTLAKGIQIALGPAGGVITQPHTGTGIYLFAFDEPWVGLINAGVQLIDQGAVAGLSAYCDANVTSGNSSNIGSIPGTNPAITAQSLRVTFRTAASGALANPVVSTGFWLTATLKRSSNP
jgi:hypothetical protein